MLNIYTFPRIDYNTQLDRKPNNVVHYCCIRIVWIRLAKHSPINTAENVIVLKQKADKHYYRTLASRNKVLSNKVGLRIAVIESEYG